MLRVPGLSGPGADRGRVPQPFGDQRRADRIDETHDAELIGLEMHHAGQGGQTPIAGDGGDIAVDVAIQLGVPIAGAIPRAGVAVLW